MTRKKHGNSEKADYLQIGGSNIYIYSKNKGLCLGAGVLTIGEGGHKDFCHKSRGVEIFFHWDWGGRKQFCTSHENVTGPPSW